MRPTNENKLGDVIKELLDKYKLKEGLEFERLKEAWNSSMPELILKRANLVALDKGKLLIRTNSAALRMELDMVKNELMEKLNNLVGKVIVTEISLL